MKKIHIIQSAIIAAAMPLAVMGVSRAVADTTVVNTPEAVPTVAQTVTPVDGQSQHSITEETNESNDNDDAVSVNDNSLPVVTSDDDSSDMGDDDSNLNDVDDDNTEIDDNDVAHHTESAPQDSHRSDLDD